MDNTAVQVAIGVGALVFNIPMVMFFVSRMLRKRDQIEDQLIAKVHTLELQSKDLEKAISLNNKDIEHTVAIVGTVSDIAERTNKLERDIDNYFNVTRGLKETTDAHEKLMRIRVNYTNSSLIKIISKIYKLHGEDGEINLGEFPTD